MVTELDEKKEAILEHIKTCKVCGADLETWREQLHEEHHCFAPLPPIMNLSPARLPATPKGIRAIGSA